MANPKNVASVASQTIELAQYQLGRLAWNHERINTSRETQRSAKDYAELRRSLARQGWETQRGVISAFDSRSPIWDDYKDVIETCMTQRQAHYARLLSEPANPELAQFRAAFCDSAGQLIVPDLIANTCNGRLTVYYDSQLLRASGTGPSSDGTDDPIYPGEPVWNVPVQLCMFKTDDQRIRAQVSENGKREAYVEPDTLDKFKTVLLMFRKYSISQGEAREMYAGVVGQRSWLVALLDFLWSNNNKHNLHKGEPARSNEEIADRCLNRRAYPDTYILFKSLNDMPELTLIVDRSCPHRLRDRNGREQKRAAKEKIQFVKHEPLTKAELDDFLTKYGKKGSGATKRAQVLGKKDWETLSTNANEVIASIAADHLANDRTNIARLADHTELFNAAWKTTENGTAALAIDALKICSHPDFPTFVAAARDGLRVKVESVAQ